MGIKQEIEQAAIAAIKCPSCEAIPGWQCRVRQADVKGFHRHVPTHQRRLSTYVAGKQKWIMPEWMGKYVKHFSDTGGWMKPEDAMNCDQRDCNFFANSVRAVLCVAVTAQTCLLLRLHKEELIKSRAQAAAVEAVCDALADIIGEELSGESNPYVKDDDPVHGFVVNFGMLRRARAALAAVEALKGET